MKDVKLRPWSINDLQLLVKYANESSIANNMTDKFPHPYTMENGIQFLSFVEGKSPATILAIEWKGELVGSIGLHLQEDIHRRNAELGYWLAVPFWGKGIISAAISLMVDYGFKHFDIDRIFARPFGTNLASQKVLEKNGFILEARFKDALIKNDMIIDELIYAKRRANIN